MTSRERVSAAIEFQGPDRIPHQHCALPAAYKAHSRLPELYSRFPSDFSGQNGQVPAISEQYMAGEYNDEWGCGWQVLQEGFIGQVVHHPLAELSNLRKYRFPKVRPHSVAPVNDDRYRYGSGGTLYERMIDLCGFENLHVELAAGNPDVLKIRDAIVEYNIAHIKEQLKGNPDCICFSDDWGTQLALTISPAMWQELFLPAYRRQFAPVQEAGKHIYFHSDGVTIDILPYLVEAGVNIFWVDLTVNSLDRLHRELGGKVCFQGLTDVQFLLPKGSPEDVRQHGKDLIAALGCFNGGFIACSEISPDQPWENVLAILETFYEFGTYPLNLRWDEEVKHAIATATGGKSNDR